MKHNVLRRVGALFLALALVLPLAAVPAWAAPAPSLSVALDKTKLDLIITRGSGSLTATADNVPTGGTLAFSWDYPQAYVSMDAPEEKENTSRAAFSPVVLGEKLTIKVTATWTDTADPNHIQTAEASCELNVNPVDLTGLNIENRPTSPMKVGETVQLRLTCTPGDATYQDVTWSSDKPDLASVTSDGTVTALKPGKANEYVQITARSNRYPNVTTFCRLNVIDANTPAILELTPQDRIPSLTIGETFPLSAVFEPARATVVWKSSNPNAVSVTEKSTMNNGSSKTSNVEITCKARGTATITVTVTAVGADGKTMTASQTRTVTVIDSGSLAATSLTPKGATSFSLSSAEQLQMAVNVTPASAYVSWSADKPGVATVDQSGLVTAVAPGEAVITARAQKADGTPLTVDFKITVMDKALGVQFRKSSEIKVDAEGKQYTQFDADDGRTRTLYVDVLPEGKKTNTYVVWTSSDPAIVTVSAPAPGNAGVLTIPVARLAGRATITATVYDSTTRQPVMKDKDTPLKAELGVVVSGITLSASTLTMYEGEAKPLSILAGYGAAENSAAASVRWDSSDSSIVSMEAGTLNAWAKGTATITATTRGGYTAKCVVTVTEDTGSVVNAGSASAGVAIKLGTASVCSQLNAIASRRGGGRMDYITSIFITPKQGVVYNSYTSEGDTGAGVSMQEEYTVAGTGPSAVEALWFVPNKTFSGEARISFIGYSNGLPISGVISVNVGEMGDVVYNASSGSPVTFLAYDFNTVCGAKTGRSLQYVTFTPPLTSVGSLYYNYKGPGQAADRVTASTQYRRTGSPSLDNVTFVPAEGYAGTVSISYRGVDASGADYTGRVTINVTKTGAATGPGDIYYSIPQDGWSTFYAQDFSSACLRSTGEALSYVRFTLPDSSVGTLFYNYRGFGDYDSAVSSTTNYRYSGAPSLGGVSFVPATTSSGQSAIQYTGYSIRGTAFTGTVHVTEGTGNGGGGGIVQPRYDYTVFSGRSVTFNANTFNNACLAATGSPLSYVRFTSLPTYAQGTLRYTYGSNNNVNTVSTSTQCWVSNSNSWNALLSRVYFQAAQNYTGTVTIPYEGYDTRNVRFTGQVVIQVTPPAATDLSYTSTNGSPTRLSAAQVRAACSGALSQELSYIIITSLPDSSAGRLYAGYSGFNTGSPVSTGARYYYSGSPGIDRLTFVPRGRFTGDVVVTYDAYTANGSEKVSGKITFHIVSATASAYFSDMRGHGWAAPAVDYLYQNNVVNGVTATTFGPDQRILRCDFVLMLCRAFRFTGGGSNFADVPPNAYYAQAVATARRLGIVSGDGVYFNPNAYLTREDAMVMIQNALRAAGKNLSAGSTTILARFPDGGAVSSYARNAVATLVQLGAVNGDEYGRLNPQATITRAEAAVILHYVMTM